MTLIRQLRYVPVAIVTGLGMASIGLVQPAQALTIGSGDTITLGGKFVAGPGAKIDFLGGSTPGKGTFNVTGGTNGFSPLVGDTGAIKDVSPTIAVLLTPGFRSNFLQIADSGGDVFFSLTEYLGFTDDEPVSGGPDTFTVSFKGIFSGVTGATNGLATFKAIVPDGTVTRALAGIASDQQDWTATIVADQNRSAPHMPTPALLPGVIGLGISAWRKRRSVG
jgi:hypothetical protein